jgi:hypothetical protein
MELHSIELAPGIYHKHQARVAKNVRLKCDFLCFRHGPKNSFMMLVPEKKLKN